MKLPEKFICATEEFNTLTKHLPAPYLRKSFTVDAESDASIVIGVCGFYELYLNGKRCTKGRLSPFISNPDDMVYYDTYTLPLQKGENVIGLWLGNGFQNNAGGYNWKLDAGPFRGAPKVAMTVSWTDAEGKAQGFEADTSFRTAFSPITFDDYRMGEQYDARLEIPGWNMPGFDDSGWKNALPAPTPKGEKRICQAPPIVVFEERKPVSITPEGDGYRYDFGANCAGVCRLKIKGTPGQRVCLFHGEWVTEENVLDLSRIWKLKDPEQIEIDIPLVHKDYYTCKGTEEETYTPTFTYHGFQYVLVTGITPEQATEDLLTYVVLSSDLKERGNFACSDPVVNKLQELTRRASLSNVHHIVTDCPQREKNGWTADAALSAEHMLLNLTVEDNLAEWHRNLCKAQREDGALPGIVPTTGWGFHWGNGPAWDSALTYVPYYIYKYRGNLQPAREGKDYMLRYLQYLTTRVDERGLLKIGLGDWCQVKRIASQFVAPLEFTDTVYAMEIAKQAAFLFDEMGLSAERDFAREQADIYRQNIRTHLIDFDTMTAFGDCQTTQAMAIFYDVLTPEEKPAAFAKLLEMIHRSDDLFDVGVLGIRILFHVLAQFGQTELALKMIVGPEYPSYGNWLQHGATSLWEDFRVEGMTFSRNHHFWGDISSWFIQYLAGIRVNPTCRDINHVDIAPCFVESLDYAEAYHIMPAGKVSSSWRREDGKCILTVEVPEGVHGEIRLPNKMLPLKSGTYCV